MLSATGCAPEDVPANQIEFETENPEPPGQDTGSGGEAEGGDETGASPARVCVAFPGDEAEVAGDTFRWVCSGKAEGVLKADIDLVITSAIEDFISQEDLDAIKNEGMHFFHGFSLTGQKYEDDAVVACCEKDYDYPGTPQPEDDDAEHAWACALDCAQQLCMKAPDVLRDFREGEGTEAPALVRLFLKTQPDPCSSHCYYDQLSYLANFIATHQTECFDAVFQENTPFGVEDYSIGGHLVLDDVIDAWLAKEIAAGNNPSDPRADWPSIEGVELTGDCGIFNWQIPEDVEPIACTNTFDNDDEDPFGVYGEGLPSSDGFVAVGGTATLDGPNVFGIEADGAAPLKGTRSYDCELENCTYAAISVDNEVVRLVDMELLTPPGLRFSSGSELLTLDDFAMRLQGGAQTTLVGGPQGTDFKFPAGALHFVASAKIHGVPIWIPVTNSEALSGTLTWVRGDQIYEVQLGSLVFETGPILTGTWRLEFTFDPWISNRHAPRAAFTTRQVDGHIYLDGGTSSDGDGDMLSFDWYVDGAHIGTGRVLRYPHASLVDHTVVLDVEDTSARHAFASRFFPPS